MVLRMLQSLVGNSFEVKIASEMGDCDFHVHCTFDRTTHNTTISLGYAYLLPVGTGRDR